MIRTTDLLVSVGLVSAVACGVTPNPECDYVSDRGTCIKSAQVFDVGVVNTLEGELSDFGVKEFGLKVFVRPRKTSVGSYYPGKIYIAWHSDVCRTALAHEYAHFYQDVYLDLDVLAHDEEFRSIEAHLLSSIGCAD